MFYYAYSWLDCTRNSSMPTHAEDRIAPEPQFNASGEICLHSIGYKWPAGLIHRFMIEAHIRPK